MIERINDVKYPAALFESLMTNSPIDNLISTKGGFPKATNYMVVGDPGVGKSTVTLDIIANIKKQGGKVLFISAEMNKVDLYLYVERYPKFGDLDIWFPQGLEEGENPQKVLEAHLNMGYDVVLIDSFVELQDILREECNMTARSAEKWLLGLMDNHNLGKNSTGTCTSFLNIQQVGKNGVFVGSNKLKHMTTGMMEIRFVDDITQDERYVVFSKNRRGPVGKQMFFDLSSCGDVSYDAERFDKSEKIRQLKRDESDKIKVEGVQFNELFELTKSPEISRAGEVTKSLKHQLDEVESLLNPTPEVSNGIKELFDLGWSCARISRDLQLPYHQIYKFKSA